LKITLGPHPTAKLQNIIKTVIEANPNKSKNNRLKLYSEIYKINKSTIK
jgi:hypothetical protein